MARLARVVVPGLAHHVTQRGNRREPVFFGSVWFVRGGTAASALGAGMQAYAMGGRNRITAAAVAAVQTYAQDFAVGGLANAALEGVIGKEKTQQFANALGQVADNLSEVENNCGAGQ